jgi:hypothetical protein
LTNVCKSCEEEEEEDCSLTQPIVQLNSRDARGGFLPLLVAVADEDFAPRVGLLAVEVLGNGSGGCRLEEAHAGLGGGPRLDRAVLLTPQGLHGADAIEVEAGDFRCRGVVLRHVRDVNRLTSFDCITGSSVVV